MKVITNAHQIMCTEQHTVGWVVLSTCCRSKDTLGFDCHTCRTRHLRVYDELRTPAVIWLKITASYRTDLNACVHHRTRTNKSGRLCRPCVYAIETRACVRQPTCTHTDLQQFDHSFAVCYRVADQPAVLVKCRQGTMCITAHYDTL